MKGCQNLKSTQTSQGETAPKFESQSPLPALRVSSCAMKTTPLAIKRFLMIPGVLPGPNPNCDLRPSKLTDLRKSPDPGMCKRAWRYAKPVDLSVG